MKEIWLSLALPLLLRARLPRPPSSYSPSVKQGSLEEKKHAGVRIFIYESCDLISCPAGRTIQPGLNHELSNRTGPPGNLLILSMYPCVATDRS